MTSKTEQTSHVGPKSTTGMAGEQPTPANSSVGQDKPRAFDANGSIGNQFTGEWILVDMFFCFVFLA
jgi:hypothetical protein